MSALRIIYYGVPGLLADVLKAYFCNLQFPLERVQTVHDLLALVHLVPRTVVILNLQEPPDVFPFGAPSILCSEIGGNNYD